MLQAPEQLPAALQTSPTMSVHPPILTTPRLLLRPFRSSDAAHFAAAVRESAISVGHWMPWPHADYTQDEARAWFAHCRQAWRAGAACELGIFARADARRVLGGIGLNRLDALHRSANLGYWVRHTAERQGIASEAAQALAQYGFRALARVRIEIVVAQGNRASTRVARKLGARMECLARNRLIVGGVPVAARVFALTPPPA